MRQNGRPTLNGTVTSTSQTEQSWILNNPSAPPHSWTFHVRRNNAAKSKNNVLRGARCSMAHNVIELMVKRHPFREYKLSYSRYTFFQGPNGLLVSQRRQNASVARVVYNGFPHRVDPLLSIVVPHLLQRDEQETKRIIIRYRGPTL